MRVFNQAKPVHHVLPDGDAGGPALRIRPKPDPMKSETHRPIFQME